MASNDTGDDQRKQMSNNVEGIVWAVLHGEEDVKVRAAKEIRNMTKTSARSRAKLAAGGVIVPLVKMLSSSNMEVKEAALLALLNLAVKNEKNKIAIGKAGAIELLVDLLESKNARLKEHAAAAILTLSASSVNKPIIGSSGATQLLVELLTIGTHQGKIDAVMALYNLSTYPDNLAVILAAEPVLALIELLKEWRKSSRVAEKISALLESLSASEEGRTCILEEEGGILTLVEVIEDGSLQSREHAVGALLTMCESKKYNYREAILKEGVIPGLFELIIQGTPKAQEKARALLQALREAPSLNKTDSASIALETIVYDHVDDIEKGSEAARKLFTEMVQASMEQSMDQHLKQNALVCMPSEFTKTNSLAKVPSM